MTDFHDLNDNYLPDPASEARSMSEMSDFGEQREILYKAQARIERQRFWLRYLISGFAVIVIVGMACVAYRVISHILCSGSGQDNLLILLAVVPIASITLITISGLFAVFSGFRRADIADAARSATNVVGRGAGGFGD